VPPAGGRIAEGQCVFKLSITTLSNCCSPQLYGNLGSTCTHFSLSDIFDFCSFLLLDESYVHSLFSKYILLEDNHAYNKVDFLFLIRKMHESGYPTLAFFCLHTFETVNPPGTFEKFLTLYPDIFDNCNMFW